jgi:hypothetical protein
VVAIDADFRDSTLTVRYEPGRVEPDALNLLADEVASLFAQRVTYCEQRQTPGVLQRVRDASGRRAERNFASPPIPATSDCRAARCRPVRSS